MGASVFERKNKVYLNSNTDTVTQEELLNRYIIENSHLRKSLLQKEFELQKKDQIIKKKNTEIQKHLNSFRYKAGSCLFDATRSLKGLIFCPINIIKLFVQYKNKK